MMKSSLKDILSCVLCDIVLAQHRANLYSQSLAEEHEKQTGKRLGKVPQVRFEDIELELRFVTDGTGTGITEKEIEITDPGSHPYSSLIIDINAETMSSLPPECVQNLKVKVSPRTIENGKEK